MSCIDNIYNKIAITYGTKTAINEFKESLNPFEQVIDTSNKLVAYQSCDKAGIVLVSNRFKTLDDMLNTEYLNIGEIVEVYFEDVDFVKQYIIKETGEGEDLINGLVAVELNVPIIPPVPVDYTNQILFTESLDDIKPFITQTTIDGTLLDVMQMYSNGKFLQYYFDIGTTQNYITKSTTYTGQWQTTAYNEFGVYENDASAVKTGAWVDSTDSVTGFTEEVGATYTIELNNDIKGNKISMRHLLKEDGGDFKLDIYFNDVIYKTMNISCLKAGDISKVITILIEEAEVGTYKFNFEFIGNGTRGYLNSLAQNLILSYEQRYAPHDYEYMATPSNQDFAIEIKPQGKPNYEFFPDHSGIQTSFWNADPIIVIGEVTYPYNEDCKVLSNNFSIIQSVDFKYPGDSNVYATAKTSQTLTDDGKLSMKGSIKPTEIMSFKNSYVMMLVGYTTTMKQFISGLDTRLNIVIPSVSTNYPLPEEGNETFNYAYIGRSTNSSIDNLIATVKINNLKKTLRLGKDGLREVEGITYLQMRNKYITKVYTALFNSDGYDTDEVISWDGEFKYINNDLVDIVKETY